MYVCDCAKGLGVRTGSHGNNFMKHRPYYLKESARGAARWSAPRIHVSFFSGFWYDLHFSTCQIHLLQERYMWLCIYIAERLMMVQDVEHSKKCWDEMMDKGCIYYRLVIATTVEDT